MKVNEVSIGWALTQPDPAAALNRVMKNSRLQEWRTAARRQRERFDRAVEDSEFCRVMGVTPQHFSLEGAAVTAAVFQVLLLVCGVAEWLEGGAV